MISSPARRALQAGRPSSSAAPPESSAEEEITGAFTAKGWAATAGQWSQARADGLIFESRTERLLHMRATDLDRPRGWLTQRPRSRRRQLLRLRATSAATGRVHCTCTKPTVPGDCRTRTSILSWSKSSIWTLRRSPTSRRGAGSCFSLGVETSYEPVADAAGSSSVAFRRRLRPLRPSHLPLFLRLRRLRQVLPTKKAKGSVGDALSGATPAGTAAPAAASPATLPVPTPKAAGTGGAAHGDLAGRLGLKAGRRTARTPPPVPATSPAKSPHVAGSAESPRRVTLAQDDTDDEQELIPAEPSPEAKSRVYAAAV